MPSPYRSCKVCGKNETQVGAISWTGQCIKCALEKVVSNTLSLHRHAGPEFDEWKHAHAAAVGAVFPNEQRPPGVPQLTARQQKNSRDSRAWRKMRAARLAFAGNRCEVRLTGCLREATEVHLNPALGGNHKLARLDDCRAVCQHCHGIIDGHRGLDATRPEEQTQAR